MQSRFIISRLKPQFFLRRNNSGIKVKWQNPSGTVVETVGNKGQSLLELAHANNIDLEGACEGSCACSTCHVILEDAIYNKLTMPSEDEDDMLDQAFGLTSTSRLGCQVILDDSYDGMIVKLPSATRNFYVDGHKPKPH